MPATMFPNILSKEERERCKNEGSREDLVYDALQKYLTPDYHVYHNVVFNYWGIRNPEKEKKESLHEHQGDFIIFHKDKGILFIESKNGHIEKYIKENGEISLSQTFPGAKDPYEQADALKWDLKNIFEREGLSLKNCSLNHAVWFISLTQEELDNMDIGTAGCTKLTLLHEDLNNPSLQNRIDAIYDLSNRKTNLTKEEFDRFERKIFNPPFIANFNSLIYDNIAEHDMNILLNEQYLILEFLQEQKSAVISGVAGTGKTHIACRKARIHSLNNEKVLFLCYNYRLCENLRKRYKNDKEMSNVDFYTLAGLRNRWCGKNSDYHDLNNYINNYTDFPYSHVIIDEGQDFGRWKWDNDDELLEKYDDTIVSCVKSLQEVVFLDETKNGTFYIFYDKYQLIQGAEIPEYIREADCKLTLYTNCRNTENIAQTATAPLTKFKNKKVLRNNIDGEKSTIYISSDKQKQIECLNNILTKCINNNIKESNIQILTCASNGLEESILYTEVENIKNEKRDDIFKYRYKNLKFDVTTVRKFKGCEASVVILTDVDKNSLLSENQQFLFYTGASRAKNKLYVIANILKEDYSAINEVLCFKKIPGQKPEAIFKTNMNVKIELL